MSDDTSAVASADDIAELFSRDPHDLTRENLDRIVEYYRADRAKFQDGSMTKAATSTRKRAKSAKKPAPSKVLTTADEDF